MFRLDLEWWPGDPPRYVFTLHNLGPAALAGFALGWSGHGKLDPAVPIENATVLERVSNYNLVAPPEGFVLRPGETWRFVVRGMRLRMRHWTEAASAAFVGPADGVPIAVAVGLCAPEGVMGAPRLGVTRFEGALDDGLALVPWPARVEVEGAVAPVGLCVVDGPAGFETLCAALFADEALLDPGGRVVRLVTADVADEEYRLRFGAEIVLEAAGQAGFFHGLVTLAQVLRGARQDPSCRFPASGVIEDAPRFGWRGVHLDVARQFYALAELERFLAVLAWNKVNRLHLHLTDDEGWRFEVRAYPELTAIGGYRGFGLPVPPLLGSGAAREGGFYTQAELRLLVALAADWQIQIVPEVDVPAHCYAALAALPWLRDADERGAYLSVQDFPNNALNPAVPEVVRFVETVFAELMDVFPGSVVHLGGDEVAAEAWASSPRAQAMGGAKLLQAGLLRRLQAMITGTGRVAGAWDEAAASLLPAGALMFAWQDAAVGPAMAAAGFDVVVAPAQLYYLNMAQDRDWWAPGASWAGCAPVEAVYRFEPASGFAAEDRARLRGVQCCIWSEQLRDRRVFRSLVFPRLSAVAETGWSAAESKDWRRFAAAVALMPVL